MNRIANILDALSKSERIHIEYILNQRTEQSVWCRYITAWISIRILKIKPTQVASALGCSITRNLLSYGCRKIDREIITNKPKTLETIVNLCKDLNLIQVKTDGIYSHSDWYDTLLKYLPSGQRSMLQILGKNSKTGTKEQKQHSSDTSSNTKTEQSTMKKADSHTSHTQHGTRSFLFTSDMRWANREALRYTFANADEQRQLYYTLLAACEWGRKCDFDNNNYKPSRNSVYDLMID